MTQDATRPHNIFEAASRLEKERREKEKKKLAPAQIPEPAQGTPLSEIFQRCKQLHQEIAATLDYAFKKGGVTPSQIRSYVSRPQNFSERDWHRVEEQKKKTESMLQELKKRIEIKKAEEAPRPPPPMAQREEQPPPPSPAPSPPKPATPQAKKPKIMTKRQWIGM